MAKKDSASGFVLEIPETFFKQIEKAQNKIIALEQQTDKSTAKMTLDFKNVADVGVQHLINKLQEAKTHVASMSVGNSKDFKAFGDLIAATAVNVGQLGKQIKSLPKPSGKNNDLVQIRRTLTSLVYAYRSMVKVQRQVQAVYTKTARTTLKLNDAEKFFNRAMASSEATLNQRINKIAKLREAERRLTDTGQNYSKELQLIRSETARLNNENSKLVSHTKEIKRSHHGLFDTMGQLKRAFALLFSISQIKGYITSIAQVRGEFELQNKALQAIIQNKDEADKLFLQITRLAVKSPFQLKDLVSYTKQLAAYRVESDRLYDTTKMLADVSAGLGVDMSRLILAYGQVKAANYLRGTELRQFSEAGINILGELSKYFSELEGKAVSVGEVFERVSKRMVSFKDVDTIFKRLTSEGGIFFNMQEIQADTVAGMISNLKDAMDIMKNQIGKENEASLKSALGTLRKMVDNWREVAFYMEKIGYMLLPNILASIGKSSLGTTFLRLARNIKGVDSLFVSYETSLTKLATKSKVAAGAVGFLGKMLGGLATLGITAIIAAISIGILELWRNATKASREAKVLRNELNSLFTGDVASMNKTINYYNTLVQRLGEVNKGSDEHREIIGQLNSQYGEYIGFIVTEKTTYDELKSSIDAVNDSIMRKAQMASQEKGLEIIYTKTAESIDNAQKKLRSWFSSSDFKIKAFDRSATEQEINEFFDFFEKEVKKSKEKLDDISLYGLLNSFFQGGIETSQKALEPFRYLQSINDYQDALLLRQEREEKMQEMLNSAYKNTFNSVQALEELNMADEERQENIKNIRKEIISSYEKEKKIKKANQDYELKRIDILEKDRVLTKESAASARKRILVWASQTIEDINNKVISILSGKDGFNEELISKFLLNAEDQASGLTAIEQKVMSAWESQGMTITQLNRIKKAGNRIDEQLLANAEKAKIGWEAVAKALGLVLDAERKAAGGKGKSGSRKDPRLEKLEKEIALLKEMNSEYEKLRKVYDEAEAVSKIREAYKDSAQSLGIGNLVATMTFDTSGLLDGFNRLMKSIAKSGSQEMIEELKNAMDSVKAEVGLDIRLENIDEIEHQLENLFSAYDLTTALQKEIGLDEGLLKQLFNVDAVSFDDLLSGLDDFEQPLIQLGEKGVALYMKYIAKVAEIKDKQLKQDAKDYYKFLLDSQDKRVKIEMDAQRKIDEARKSKRLTEPQKVAYEVSVRKKMESDIAELDWKDFKATDLYRMAFEDLQRVGTSALNVILAELQRFSKESGKYLDTSNFRELMTTLKNVRAEVETRSPLKALYDDIEAYKKASKQLEIDARQFSAAQSTQQQAQKKYDDALAAQEKARGLQEEQEALENVLVAEAELSVANEDLSRAGKKVIATENEKTAALDRVQDKISSLKDAYDAITDVFSQVVDLVRNIAEGLGMAFSDETNAVLDGFNKGFQVMSQILGVVLTVVIAVTVAGETMQAALWPLLVIGAALGGIFALISLRNAKQQKIIDSEKKKVEKLSDAYDKLVESVKNALSTTEKLEARRKANLNVEERIASVEKQINAERGKKNHGDDEEVEKMRDEIKHLREEKVKLQEEFIEDMGGFGSKDNMAKAAQDFANAWLEAYKETGDGLDALEGKWQEYIENMVAKQLMLKGAKAFLEAPMMRFDQILKDGTPSPEDLDAIRDAIAQKMPALNEFWKNIADAFGIASDVKGGDLSGLQKGIQSITEPTAQALEALLNSMRFYVSDTNVKLTQLVNRIFSQEEGGNPILFELRNQTRILTTIDDRLSSVIKSGHPMGGSGIKSFI